MSLINKFFVLLLKSIRPLFGPAQCRFTVSCTEFAILQLHEKSSGQALLAIGKRLFLCNPFFSNTGNKRKVQYVKEILCSWFITVIGNYHRRF